jgi:hypothetical protein
MRKKSTMRSKTSTTPVDPKSALGKLFYFWDAYDEEEKLLIAWHDSTARVRRPSGNVLFDSFLDTWGKGKWSEVRNPGRVPWSKRTYFQTLGVVSHRLRQECLKVLDKFLVRQRGQFKNPPQLKPGANPEEAERQAEMVVHDLVATFKNPEIASLKQIDRKVKQLLNRRGVRENIYLNALLRMMLIETDCFLIQSRFLQKGTL